jgi:hypothetical protein
MAEQKCKPPATQRSFTSPWRELDYLCGKVRYWLYDRRSRSAALRYLPRLRRVLTELDDDEIAILAAEARALKAELAGQAGDAVKHRKREIELMERLHAEARLPKYSARTRAYMLRNRTTADLQQRRAILAGLQTSRTVPRMASA